MLTVLYNIYRITDLPSKLNKDNNIDTLAFVNTVNKLRLNNKGKVYRLTGTVNGSKFKIAGTGTDLFSFYLEDVNMASSSNLKVSEYKEHLNYWSNYFVRLNKRNKY